MAQKLGKKGILNKVCFAHPVPANFIPYFIPFPHCGNLSFLSLISSGIVLTGI